jgi:MFS transporter, ACS family, aldohexuronate transporter
MAMTESSPAIDPPRHGGPGRGGNLRWWICSLLFVATMINYMDRGILGVLKETVLHDLKLNEIDYGNIVFWFQGAYAVGNLCAGRLIDVIGVRLGYSLAVGLWSVAAICHAGVRSALGFDVARVGLGVAEGGNFPGAIRTVTDWFPQRERALATGWFNFGSNFGAVVTPLLVLDVLQPLVGWRGSFIVVGALGAIWLVAWLVIYREPEVHPWLSAEELAHIKSDPVEAKSKLPWMALIGFRATWAYIIGTLLTSPIWWFYLFWAPGFLQQQFKLDKHTMSWCVAVIYMVAGLGSIGAGWLAETLMRRGWTVNAARKTALGLCALCALPVFMTPHVLSPWVATALLALAAAAHQGWSANFYTIVSDTMPREAVGSVVGIGGMAGAVVAMGNSELVGHILQWTHDNYAVPFAMASGGYIVAWVCLQVLLPVIRRIDVGPRPPQIATPGLEQD